MSNIFNTPDTTSTYTASDIQQNKVMAVLSYLGILVLIPLFAAKDSPFARFHALQGINLFILEIAFGIVSFIITLIFAFISGILSTIWGLISWLVSLAFFVLVVIGLVNAAQGKAKELPLIGSIRIIK